jgi:enamine deaminase RidA (YjgF/YER057c/UK114 family)
MLVKTGNMLHMRGQTGHDFNGDFHGLGDPAAQAEQAMANVKTLLAEGGARLEDICKVKVWVTDRAHLAPVMGVLARHLKGIHVATSEVIVVGLARVYMDMEIDVYAVIDRET